ncbi:hypothetical protein [Methylicorpusculum sp.]|uniref:hypothetical protein n=1 Tax=Methylicorpusculum sp. TaxID=2713644 RepID=UPI002719BB8B|nr:hypothetical protein [Methylicorpusculum sp.]MDO8843392.1 hypothetical protein [Methylicorpusculum sp.]
MKNQDITTDKKQDVDKKRRSFTKAGLATPVIATLASRPVFGAQCLSQQLSGNMSQVGTGSCNQGNLRTYWLDPILSATQNQKTWTWKGTQVLIYGEYQTPNTPTSPCTDPSKWSKGKLFNQVFVSNSGYAGSSTSSKSIREVLCTDDYLGNFAAAYLNAQSVANYVLTTQQVLGLWSGNFSAAFPTIGDAVTFLKSTGT